MTLGEKELKSENYITEFVKEHPYLSYAEIEKGVIDLAMERGDGYVYELYPLAFGACRGKGCFKEKYCLAKTEYIGVGDHKVWEPYILVCMYVLARYRVPMTASEIWAMWDRKNEKMFDRKTRKLLRDPEYGEKQFESALFAYTLDTSAPPFGIPYFERVYYIE